MERAIREYKNEISSSKNPAVNTGNVLIDLAAARRRHRIQSDATTVLEGDYETGQVKAKSDKVLPGCDPEIYELWDPKPVVKVNTFSTGITNTVFQNKLKVLLESHIDTKNIAAITDAAKSLNIIDAVVHVGYRNSTQGDGNDDNVAISDAISAAASVIISSDVTVNVSDVRRRGRIAHGADIDAIARKKITISPAKVVLPSDVVITPCSSMWLPGGKVIGCRNYRGNKKREDYHVELQVSVCVSGQRDERREEERQYFGEVIFFIGCEYNNEAYRLVLCRIYSTKKSGRFHLKHRTTPSKLVILDASTVINIAGLVKSKDNSEYYIHDNDDPSFKYAEEGDLKYLW
jgi:hypothetical protein